VTFGEAVWFFPAFTLHVLEEWLRFVTWMQHASARLTRRQYNAIHTAGIFVFAVSALTVWRFPNQVVVFLLLLTPGVFDNTLFHAGASMPPSFQIPEMLCSRTEIRKYNQLVGDPVAK